MRLLIALIILIVIIAVPLLSGCTSSQTEDGNTTELIAIDFQLQSLNGDEVTLSDLRGQPVMLNFWAVRCAPCRLEMPLFQEIYEDPEWIEEGLKSNVYHPNLNLFNDLMAIKSPILKKQKNQTQQISKTLEDLIHNHLKQNEGKAFTSKVLLDKLEEIIENRQTYEYFKANSKGLLNKLIHNKKIKSTEKDGNTYYFF